MYYVCVCMCCTYVSVRVCIYMYVTINQSINYLEDSVFNGGEYSDYEMSEFHITTNIEHWLDGPYAIYIDKFKKHGYDDTTFLLGLKEQELIDMGIDNRGHRKKILVEVDRLPPEEIEQDVPVSVYSVLETYKYISVIAELHNI